MKDYMHKEYPKTCDPKDFYAQVKRTVNGKPVTQDQIDMIVSAIRENLQFKKDDFLLDLGCGNGALSSNIFDEIDAYLGVDFSEYLINIAKQNFELKPKYLFKLSNVSEYISAEKNPLQYTKVLIYGSFSYFSFEDVNFLLNTLNTKFINVNRIFIGNLPDKDRADIFYHEGIDYTAQLEDKDSAIGIWRDQEELKVLANESGWDLKVTNMPKEYYASHYRFDLLLTRKLLAG